MHASVQWCIWRMLGGTAEEGGFGGVWAIGVWALAGEGPLPGAAPVDAQLAQGHRLG